MDIVESVKKYSEQIRSIMNENKVATTVISLVIVLYAVMGASRIPGYLGNALSKWYMGAAFIGLVGYIAYNQEPTLAIMVALAVLITMQTLSTKQTVKDIVQKVQEVKEVQEVQEVAPKEVKEVQEVKEDKEVQKVSNDDVKKMIEENASEIIKETFAEVTSHKEQAAKAIDMGNMSIAESHMEQATHKEEVVRAIIEVQTHLEAAKQANDMGNHEEATKHELVAEQVKNKVVNMIQPVVSTIPEGNDSEIQLASLETGMSSYLGKVPTMNCQQVVSESELNIGGFEGSELASI